MAPPPMQHRPGLISCRSTLSGNEPLTPAEARALAAELILSARLVEAATLNGEVIDWHDCKPGEFYVAIVAADWSGPIPFILSTTHVRPGEPMRPCMWGFSVYQEEPGYRTIGAHFDEWMSRPAQHNVIIRRDYDRVAAHKRST